MNRRLSFFLLFFLPVFLLAGIITLTNTYFQGLVREEQNLLNQQRHLLAQLLDRLRVVFLGVDVLLVEQREPLLGERLGFVFQSFNLLARTSALENTALPLFYAGSGPARAGERMARARAASRRCRRSRTSRSWPRSRAAPRHRPWS